MSDFEYQPLYASRRVRKPRVLVAKMGDGYEQRVADGINPDLEVWEVSFANTKATIAAIDSFLGTRGGVTAFTWTPGGESEILVVCREWSRAFEGQLGTITATFERVLA